MLRIVRGRERVIGAVIVALAALPIVETGSEGQLFALLAVLGSPPVVPYGLAAVFGIGVAVSGRYSIGAALAALVALGSALGAATGASSRPLLAAGELQTPAPPPRPQPVRIAPVIAERVHHVAALGAVQLDETTCPVAHQLGVTSEEVAIEPGHDGFLVHYGFDRLLLDTYRGSLSLRVVGYGSGGEEQLLARSWKFGGWRRPKTVWTELSIDLSEHPGLTRVRLEKTAVPAAPFDGAEFDIAPTDLVYWTRPHYWSRREPDETNVMLISLDTLRPDHLGFYGYRRNTSPSLDAWAADAVVFEQAIAQAPWTTPSHYAMLSSTYPSENGSGAPDQLHDRVIPDRVPFLSHLLARAGYQTTAITGRGAISARYGFHRGFSCQTEHGTPGFKDARAVYASTERWLSRHADHRWFLFLHTYEPHQPWVSTTFVDAEPTLRRLERTLAMYDGDIRETDTVMGKLFAKLAELGVADDTLIIITSDHGEDFGRFTVGGKPYIEHGHSLYDDLLRVPLIIKLPARQRVSRRVAEQVRSIDIVPTVLDLLGLERPPHLSGTSLRALIEGRAAEHLPAFAEATTKGAALRALRADGFKLIERVGLGQALDQRTRLHGDGLPFPPRRQLYDLGADPGERNDIAGAQSMLADSLAARLLEFANRAPPVEAGRGPPIDAELMESLRALGYMEE